MHSETEKHIKGRRAFTLVELILVVGTIALVAATLVGLIGTAYRNWQLSCSRSTLLNDGQAVIEQIVRTLRQAQGFSEVTESTDQAGAITFSDVDDTLQQFSLNTQTHELEYGPPGSLSALTGSVSSLTFTCYDINANPLTGPVPPGSIQSVHVETTLADTQTSFTIAGRAFCPKDFTSVVINEIMYNPAGSTEAPEEWVEIYNTAGSPVNVAGWTIGNDSLSAHPQFGNGSTIIPANGYAVITAEPTNVFQQLTTGGDCEKKNTFTANWTIENWDITKNDAHTGSYKAESSINGSSSLYTDITVDSGFNSYLFIFWEMTTAPVEQTQMTATIRDLSDTVLATAYSGQMNAAWTCHTMDLAAYAGQSIRIHFSTNKTTASGLLLLDDIYAASSYVNLQATRLSCGDGQITNGLANDSDTITLTNAGRTIDSVTYDDAWGGDGDGKTLARISPLGPSDDADNWTSGPVNGTPGSAN